MSDMHDEFYDVIIVGAGSAGGTLGARLSQDASRTVLLLEAGPDYGPTAAAQPVLVRDAHDSTATDHDWGYVGAAANLDRELPCYAGKIVGGSSATNNVMALRGHPGDYDAWAVDNPGWGYADVLPAFTRLERDQDFTASMAGTGRCPFADSRGRNSPRRSRPSWTHARPWVISASTITTRPARSALGGCRSTTSTGCASPLR
jgi:choline dehydrogenase